MIEAIIRWSIGNRLFVLLATVALVGAGIYSLKNTPVDAIPDLSDVQVIIKTTYAGQAPPDALGALGAVVAHRRERQAVRADVADRDARELVVLEAAQRGLRIAVFPGEPGLESRFECLALHGVLVVLLDR